MQTFRGAIAGLLFLGAVVGYGQEPAGQKFTATGSASERFDKGHKWAVVIGVNEYIGTGIPKLNYCVADAKLLAKQLVERCGYDKSNILIITDDQPELHLRPLLTNLDQKLRGWLSLAKPGDTVLVYFSGHGFLDAAGQGFLAPQDCRRENLGLSAYRTDELRNHLRQCEATQKILVLDCCHAGSGKGGPVGPSGQELSQSFQSAEGLVTIASCRKQETSLEWDKKGQGLFTYFFAAGLGGEADDNHDDLVDNLELYRYVSDEVPKVALGELNGVQTPVQIIGDDVAGVFALSRIGGAPDQKPIPEKSNGKVAFTLRNVIHAARGRKAFLL